MKAEEERRRRDREEERRDTMKTTDEIRRKEACSHDKWMEGRMKLIMLEYYFYK